ncbi:uncharacterized protein BDZ99DRAFT_410999 [Mytilinidion resinicola]|uniref:Xylanolytic transcriptional activator regulatory domain-containing protein n=1 Tax=Mytilinidion resinicola TaxID=574789 RepID=A0A6A6Z1C2_9PEZI|nr:uncharacterized protein BDZ99DRAFT_410999 [Mytilinidion resinicola]KAF2814463.1 hypothetical protein BDZ99DRAFT_410999 [Mytilinidion resinicola]
MSTMITFAANNEFFRKRKRVHRACEACKKRRKRCSHTFDDDVTLDTTTESPPDGRPPTTDPGTSRTDHSGHSGDIPSHFNELTPDSGNEQRHSPQIPLENVRPATPPSFVGYLNPEAVLREEIHARGQPPAAHCVPLGQWVQGRENEREPEFGSRPGPPDTPINDTSLPSSKSVVIQAALQNYLDAIGVSIVPNRENQQALLRIYFTYVQPLLPILDEKLFLARYANDTESRTLLQAIFIVASKHVEARPHLILSDDPRLLNPREFSQRLYTSVVTSIEAKLETNRIVLVQVLALISLHCEGPDGAEESSMHLAQAIHHAHTFGLHFGRQWKHTRDEHSDSHNDIFWCLWSLDKINACINGRPLIMNDADNGLTKIPTEMDKEKRQSPFGVWLQISKMLDKVIDFYRPGVDPAVTGWEDDDFLGFEELVGDGEDRLEGPMITLLSLFHHSMAMASHKSLSINDPVRATGSNVRQSLSATRVISILTSEPPESLPPLPIVPYALSLAMSVVYRHWRQRRLKMHRNRAKEELKQCVKILNRLRTAWWSAGAMADLGMAALSNDERNSSRPRSIQPSTGSAQKSNATSANPASSASNQQQTHSNHSVDSRLNNSAPTPLMNYNMNTPVQMPGQHPISSERAEQFPMNDFDFTDSSPDWLNFDTAFENFDTLLGSSGADLSNELFKPFNYEGFDFLDSTTS